MTDKLREAAQQDIRCECCGYMTHHREHLGCIRAAALAQQDAQAVPQDLRYTPGHVLVPNQVAWGIVGSSGHARKRAVDALRDLLNAAPTPPAQRVTLTDEEIRDIHWSKPMDEYAYARAVIEAYETKNGINRG